MPPTRRKVPCSTGHPCHRREEAYTPPTTRSQLDSYKHHKVRVPSRARTAAAVRVRRQEPLANGRGRSAISATKALQERKPAKGTQGRGGGSGSQQCWKSTTLARPSLRFSILKLVSPGLRIPQMRYRTTERQGGRGWGEVLRPRTGHGAAAEHTPCHKGFGGKQYRVPAPGGRSLLPGAGVPAGPEETTVAGPSRAASPRPLKKKINAIRAQEVREPMA